MMRRFLIVAAAAFTLASAGCGEPRTAEGTETGCATCHGFPPVAPHPQAAAGAWVATDCAVCHVTSVNATTGDVIPVSAGGTHANGTVEGRHPVPYPSAQHGPAAIANLGSCKACHGADLLGGTAGVSCNQCHNGWQTNCTFCHDAVVDAPTFHTRISASAISPPECSACHGAGYSASAQTVNTTTHMNGTRDIPDVTCTSCHGTAGVAAAPRPAAPPVDKLGRTTSAEVGAHAAHLDGKTFSNGFACTSCHAAVGAYSLKHADGVANVGFTAAIVAGGNFTSGTCSSVYCHGATLAAGGSDTAPNWAGSVTCTSCHANPPATGRHALHMARTFITCSTCHEGYATTQANSAVTVNKGVHVNGTKDVAALFNATARTCGGCHAAGSKSWDL